MFARIANFELKYQLRNPVQWAATALFFLLTFGSVTVDAINIGSGGNIHKNAPVAIAETIQILSLFYMFVTTAFVANVIVRDDDSGFGPIVRTTAMRKFDYLMGRFSGAYLAAALSFASVPIALYLGTLMPWVDPETLGPNRLSDYLQAYFALAMPNLLVTSAIFFLTATATRSMMYSYAGVVVFLVLYLVTSSIVSAKPELREIAGYVEPFALIAVRNVTRYWTSAEQNALMPTITGAILANRAIWIVASIVTLAIAFARFRFSEGGSSERSAQRQLRRELKLARAVPAVVARLPEPRPEAAWITRLLARSRLEMALVFRSPAFLVLLAAGAFNSVGGLAYAGDIYGTPARPLTFTLIQVLRESFSLVPFVVAIYYSGELVWRDRERRMHEIIDATSLPNWAYMLPKSLAVAGVLIATLGVSVLVAIAFQLLHGVEDLAIGHYVTWYLLPQAADVTFVAILAVFIQALSPNKYAGWALMVAYLVVTITFSSIGLDHPLYLYGATGTTRFSDMNGAEIGGRLGWWLRLYWGLFSVLLAVLAHLLWRRGTEGRLLPRLARLRGARWGVAGGVAVIAGAGFAATGAFLFYNMNVLNEYVPGHSRDKDLANYERRYLRFANLPQPSLAKVSLNVALFPRERLARTSGAYRFVNDTDTPIPELHVRLHDIFTRIQSLEVAGARLVKDDPGAQYRVYRFTRPLAPGAAGTLRFRTLRHMPGLAANIDDEHLVGNGTRLNNLEIAPSIGMNRDGLLTDPVKRRKYGLPAELRLPKLGDPNGAARNVLGDAAWVQSDITVSTDAGQFPVAPGRKVFDMTRAARRTARFVSTAPMLNFFSIQSGAYAERKAVAGDVALSVLYDPRHAFNVDRMLAAMRLSLGYFVRNFGPYQFDHLRIVEFPGYDTSAQAFAGTIPYSERIGFIAETRDPDAIDYVTYVTAHETAHQYWAHQLVAADMQGSTMLVESLAQYSALMVEKHLYGEDKMRRFLKYELDKYLAARGSERIEELPLDRVEEQPYIHYRKGSVVLYLLQDRLGEDRVNRMLAGLIDRYRFKGRPFASSRDLLDGFLGLARTQEEHDLVLDLIDRITLYDLKARQASIRRLPDGKFETTFTIEAHKAYADGKGAERPAALADVIDVGLFDARPGTGPFASRDVIAMRRVPVHSGTQEVTLVTARKPSFAGVDPYNKYVDRNSDDNLIAVDSAT